MAVFGTRKLYDRLQSFKVFCAHMAHGC